MCMSSGVAPEPFVTPVRPSEESGVRTPSGDTANPPIEPLPALATKAKRSSLLSTSQHGAACCVDSEPVMSDSAPPASLYDDTAPAPASDTISWSRLVTAKPNGPAPLDGRLPADAR